MEERRFSMCRTLSLQTPLVLKVFVLKRENSQMCGGEGFVDVRGQMEEWADRLESTHWPHS